MHPVIQNYMTEHLGLSVQETASLAACIKFTDFEKGWHFLTLGDQVNKIGFVIEGLFKLTKTNISGESFNMSFASEGGFITDYVSILLAQNCNVTIEAMEPGIVAWISIDDFYSLINRHTGWQRAVRKILENEILQYDRRVDELLKMDARQRYQSFIANHRSLLNRIARYEIASYLGITPVSLSRLGRRN